MIQTTFSRYDLACLQKWGVSTVEDTRTREEAEQRLVVPEWLRRPMWRHFWADQDSPLGEAKDIDTPALPEDMRRRPAAETSWPAQRRDMSGADHSNGLIFLERGIDVGTTAIILLLLAALACGIYVFVNFGDL